MGGQGDFVRAQSPYPKIVNPDYAVYAHERLQHVHKINAFRHAFHQYDHRVPEYVKRGDQHQYGEKERTYRIHNFPFGL